MGTVRIISRSNERFKDRQEAGRLLARQLVEMRGKKAVVLGIPRGGIIVARELARALDAELDIVLSHKLRTPGHQELALGSIAEDGKLFLNEGLMQELGVGQSYVQREGAQQFAEIKRRAELIRRTRPKVPLKGRLVIVTDDGVATGATTQAALWAVRQEQPSRLITAIPVGAEETIRRLAEDTDEIVCLRAPQYFTAVGQFYVRFDQVEEDEMLEILKEESERQSGNRPADLRKDREAGS
jgi:putative phosphoribosyl transferase